MEVFFIIVIFNYMKYLISPIVCFFFYYIVFIDFFIVFNIFKFKNYNYTTPIFVSEKQITLVLVQSLL